MNYLFIINKFIINMNKFHFPGPIFEDYIQCGMNDLLVVDNYDGVSHVVGLLDTVAVRVILLRTPSRTANLHFAGRESFRRAA